MLLPHIIWVLIHHKAPTLYPDGVALGKIGVQVCTVTAALMRVALKVPVLVEDYLLKIKYDKSIIQYMHFFLLAAVKWIHVIELKSIVSLLV